MDQAHPGQICALDIIDQHTVAGYRIKVCVQQDDRKGQIQKGAEVPGVHFCPEQDDAGTVRYAQISDLLFHRRAFFKDISDLQTVILFPAFAGKSFGYLLKKRSVGHDGSASRLHT